MTLTLNMLRCPDTVAPQTRTVTGGEFSIGRGTENDWMLPDSERFLSKRHCLIANGTYLNGEAQPIGHGQPRDLRDGDRLRLGAYEIELRIAETAMLRQVSTPHANPFALDPFAPSATPAKGPFEQDPLLRHKAEDQRFVPGSCPASINLPPDYAASAAQPDGMRHRDVASGPAGSGL